MNLYILMSGEQVVKVFSAGRPPTQEALDIANATGYYIVERELDRGSDTDLWTDMIRSAIEEDIG